MHRRVGAVDGGVKGRGRVVPWVEGEDLWGGRLGADGRQLCIDL